MKIPYSLINQLVDIDVTAREYEEKMVFAGNAIESVTSVGEGITGVVVGRIVKIEKHGNSDHLLICKLDVGRGEPVQIITGADNVFEGALVPVALDGAVLAGGKKIKTSKMRGELSQGMLCAGEEIDVPEHLYPGAGVNGILILRDDAPLGSDIFDLIPLKDKVFDFEILANRPDCLSAVGIAKESAAVLGGAYHEPNVSVRTVGKDVREFVDVEVRDSDLAPRYIAAVIDDVRIAPSPMWLRKALNGAGLRSINNIVDITNYVMMETGHPMHAFDLSKVRSGEGAEKPRIIVRRAKDGESLTTLDGKERLLTHEMLVIADGERATGLAGIMGGEESEITYETKRVMFECAAFDRTSIRLTSRALGMRTDASGRFERGVAPETAMFAMLRACHLVNELDAGDVAAGMYDIYGKKQSVPTVHADCGNIRRIIGVEVSDEDIVRILRSLWFDVALEGGKLTVVPPAFRLDVDQEADLAEEVIRLYGYHHLHSTLPASAVSGKKSDRMKLRDTIRDFLTARGLSEILTFSFTNTDDLRKLNLAEDDTRLAALPIMNPLGEDTAVMRTTLVPHMLKALALNQSRRVGSASLYEISRVFETVKDGEARKDGELPFEREMLCVGMYGGGADFYTARELAELLLKLFGVEAEVKRITETYLHPGRAASLVVKASEIARIVTIGEIHPDVAEAFGVERGTYIAEIDIDALARHIAPQPKIAELPRYPAVERDVALALDMDAPLGEVTSEIKKACGKLLEDVRLFDVYRGAQLGGKKSAAFALKFRAADRTLTDDEASKLMDKLLKAVDNKFGAKLRM
ncbi:MAG: phenylalanine--tRNA ligase subunit beta [Oscillospiraceae bacterium]|jgi:phenylalanyl-tRNA synthetase beta chain|nr:phenylalanine--tRNA ligase subunit beta [Oscillospiraceae bacterium]